MSIEFPKKAFIYNPISCGIREMGFVEDRSLFSALESNPTLTCELGEAFLLSAIELKSKSGSEEGTLQLEVDRQLVFSEMPLKTYMKGPSSAGLGNECSHGLFRAFDFTPDLEAAGGEFRGIFMPNGTTVGVKVRGVPTDMVEVKLHVGLYKLVEGGKSGWIPLSKLTTKEA